MVSNLDVQRNGFWRLHELRRWLLTDADRHKAPAAGWTHPRAADVRRPGTRVTKVGDHLRVTSNTPGTWLTRDESFRIAAGLNKEGRHIVPAYVHSEKVDRPEDSCGGYNFLDLDNGSLDDPEGKGQAFFDRIVEAFLVRWPDALRVETVSGNGRQHILYIADPADYALWQSDGKQTREALGAPQWKVEWWSPFGDGRYRCFTNRWIGEKPGPDHCLPVIRHAELMDFFDTDLAGLWKKDDATERREKAAAAQNRYDETPYPPDAILAMSEKGAALRVSHYLAEQGRPLVMLDGGQIYVPLRSGVLSVIGADPGGVGNRALTALRWEADQAIAPDFMNCAESEKGAMVRHQREFLAWCNSRGARFTSALCGSVAGLAESEPYGDLIRQTTETGGPLTMAALNPIPLGEALYALSDGQVYSSRRRAVMTPDEAYQGLRTTDAPALTEPWVPGAYEPNPDKCKSTGQLYAALLLRAWGDSWPLLVFLTIRPIKDYGCGVLVDSNSDTGKTSLLTSLEDLGLAGWATNPKWAEGRSETRNFNYLADNLCRHRLVVLDDLTQPVDEMTRAIPVTPIKSVIGAPVLSYEVKNAHPVTRPRQGNLIITGNYDLLINVDDPGIKNRLLFIPPPVYDPDLDPRISGLDPQWRGHPDCKAAILDAYFEQVHRIGVSHSPPYTNESHNASEHIRLQHLECYEGWRAKNTKGKGKGKGGDGGAESDG